MTRREFEVLTALAEHLTNKEIAERLFISPETVKTHVSNLFRKFDVSGRRHLLAAAKKAGLLGKNSPSN